MTATPIGLSGKVVVRVVPAAEAVRLREMAGAVTVQATVAPAEMTVLPPPPPEPEPPPPPPPRLVPLSGATGVAAQLAAAPHVLRGLAGATGASVTLRAGFSRVREPLTTGALVLNCTDRPAVRLTVSDTGSG